MYDVQWPKDQFLIFVNMTRDMIMIMSTTVLVPMAGGEVGQGHVGVNGGVKDEVRGETICCLSSRTKTWMGRRNIVRVSVAGQRRGISGTW